MIDFRNIKKAKSSRQGIWERKVREKSVLHFLLGKPRRRQSRECTRWLDLGQR